MTITIRNHDYLLSECSSLELLRASKLPSLTREQKSEIIGEMARRAIQELKIAEGTR